MNSFALGLIFLSAFLSVAVCNRYTEARVPVEAARGPSAASPTSYICFQDEEYNHDICFREGPAPRFYPEETVYGAQTYDGIATAPGNRDEVLGYVYGHSLEGKVSIYLAASIGDDLFVYSFDYCPRVWREVPDAKFSVYHVIKGSNTLPSMETFSKPSFTQQNDVYELGQPGGKQVFCSIERFGEPSFPPPPPTPAPVPEPTVSSFASRAPSFEDSGDVMTGFCFYDPYVPQKLWYIVGGSDEYEAGEGRQIHQYYHGKVEDFDMGVSSMAYGHAPRGQKWLTMTSVIEDKGMVTYVIAFDPKEDAKIQGAYMWVGSLEEEMVTENLRRVEVRAC